MFYAVVHLFKTINSMQLLDLEGLKVQHSNFLWEPNLWPSLGLHRSISGQIHQKTTTVGPEKRMTGRSLNNQPGHHILGLAWSALSPCRKMAKRRTRELEALVFPKKQIHSAGLGLQDWLSGYQALGKNWIFRHQFKSRCQYEVSTSSSNCWTGATDYGVFQRSQLTKFHPAWLGRVASVEDAASIAASPSQRPQQREPPQVVPMAKNAKRFSGEESKVTSMPAICSCFLGKTDFHGSKFDAFGFHNSCSKLSKTFHHCEAVKGLVWFVSSPISSTCCTMKKTGMSVILWWFTTCPCFEPVPSMTTEIVP